MELDRIEKIVKLLETSSVTEFVLEEGGSCLRINRAAAQPGGAMVVCDQSQNSGKVGEGALAPIDEKITKVESPIVGTYYSRPAPDAEAYVAVGDRVNKGDKLCIVEAMKIMNEIEAPAAGTVEKIFLSDGQVVEYGECLFHIRVD
jgi:acetyl-CoA carboxylase biotin carboxyl carrier protein